MSQRCGIGCFARAGGFFFPILAVGIVSGCMSQQLGFATRRTANAWIDIHYQQVVDNLARMAMNPGFLPYLAVAGQGSVQVTDNGNASLALNVASKALGAGPASVGTSRNVTGTWSLGTITSPEKIRGMEAVYLRAIRGRAAGDPAFGWLKIGCRRDVPKQACFVGRYEDLFVWIMPDGVAGLSNLMLAILDVATTEDVDNGRASGLRSLNGTGGEANVPRRNFQIPAVGPVFTPGNR